MNLTCDTNQRVARIALWKPKWEHNVANVLRAAACFGALDVTLYAPQYVPATGKKGDRKPRPLRHKDYAHTALHHVERAMLNVPPDCVPVAVELVSGAQELTTFAHPERAVYLFGPENGSLQNAQLRACRYVVQVPSRGCLNLAACASIVLYDRACKMV